MIYLDHGATSMHKPVGVGRAMARAVERCGNPGRGGHGPAMEAARAVYRCRELAARLFDCREEQVVFTGSCTHGLNIAIQELVKPGGKVLITGFEHNAVTRPLAALGAKVEVAGRKLFDPEDTLSRWEDGLKKGVDAAVFTQCSNVFGYILPIREMASLCKAYGVPFAVDGAQGAGNQPLSLEALGADFIAAPGHKGLLGPHGTGVLLCGRTPRPLLYGGTGSFSKSQSMPEEMPDRLEAGTLNVPGIAGLAEGISYVLKVGVETIGRQEARMASVCAKGLKDMGLRVFSGRNQGGTLSFVAEKDCEELAQALGKRGIAVRAGLHCAPLAHESAGTLETGTVRLSFGHDAKPKQVTILLQALRDVM